ncbi:MAG TPA: DUF4390 domain-containing protein [Rubrivivax sp.]|nr:DUF4390 domain-containing protein [Rubrivivax sp.]
MRPALIRQRLLQGLALTLLLWVLGLSNLRAQGVELAVLQVQRQDGELTLDFDARMALPKGVEDAMQRGVPVYFVAQATLYRARWYWRDERVARVQRTWRVAFQPLTATWRVGFGGFNQSFQSLSEALSTVSRSSRWKVADLSLLEADSRYYLEFSYRLDNSQLPSPLQLGLGAQAEWVLGVERTLRLE